MSHKRRYKSNRQIIPYTIVSGGYQKYHRHTLKPAYQNLLQTAAWLQLFKAMQLDEYNYSGRVSGAEQEYLLLKAKVKHDQAWSPNGRVTVTY